MDQQAYWDNAAAEKTFTIPLPLTEFRRLVPPSAAVLDIGCGYGRTLAELRRNGYSDLTGVDFSDAMLARGARQFPELRLRKMRAGRLDFPDASFDAVLLCAVLTCVVADADQQALLAEAGRVLKPGGAICVLDFLLNDDERNLVRYRSGMARHGVYGVFDLPEGATLRHHDREWPGRCLSGYEKAYYDEPVYTTMNGNQSNGLVFLGRKP